MAKAVDKAYQTVRDRIVRGVYPASSRITEQEVAAVAGVSRTPVREALRKLHAEGLLEFVPHQGAIVTEWTSEDRDDVFELRAMLESYGAARAARRMTAEGIAELRQLAEDQYHETLEQDRRLSGTCGRSQQPLSPTHPRIRRQLAARERAVLTDRSAADDEDVCAYQDEDLIRSASHHLEIVRALEARDGDWSAALMRSHILGARGALRLL